MTTPKRPATTEYDYRRQAWVVNGRYVRCRHPDTMDCQCYGKLHAGECANVSSGGLTR